MASASACRLCCGAVSYTHLDVYKRQVPQMLVLFLMLSLLEDVGYMARIAFILDRVFRKFGLSGKSLSLIHI